MKRNPKQSPLTAEEIAQRISELLRPDRTVGQTMLAEEYNERTFANMNVALERACARLAPECDDHETRKVIAQKIIECARSGKTSLGELTAAGVDAFRLLTAIPLEQEAT